jgi:IS5 family transposase
MKLHVGVAGKTRRVHRAAVTTASVHDSQGRDDLLHGEETRVRGNSVATDQPAAMDTFPFSITQANEKNGAGEIRLFRPGGGNTRGRALLTMNQPGRPGFA